MSNHKTDHSQWLINKIRKEGVQARNIIKYNVPLDKKKVTTTLATSNNQSIPSGKIKSTPFNLTSSSSYYEVGDHRHSATIQASTLTDYKDAVPLGVDIVQPTIEEDDDDEYDDNLSSRDSSTFRQSSLMTSPGQFSHFNASIPTNTAASDYRARYWGQMLDTLKRTVDEIYSACELDESEVECREVIMILEHSKQDFFALIEKMNVLRNYERTDASQRPTALAWNERSTTTTATTTPNGSVTSPVDERERGHSFLVFDGLSHQQHQSSLSPAVYQLIPYPITTSLESSPTHQLIRLTANKQPASDLGPCKDKAGELFDLRSSGDQLIRSNRSSNNSDSIDRQRQVNNDKSVEINDRCRSSDRDCLGNSVTEEEDYNEAEDDDDDNTLSQDIRQLDAAIASVTSTERQLTHQLNQAQLDEAAYCRRLIAAEQEWGNSRRHLMTQSANQLITQSIVDDSNKLFLLVANNSGSANASANGTASSSVGPRRRPPRAPLRSVDHHRQPLLSNHRLDDDDLASGGGEVDAVNEDVDDDTDAQLTDVDSFDDLVGDGQEPVKILQPATGDHGCASHSSNALTQKNNIKTVTDMEEEDPTDRESGGDQISWPSYNPSDRHLAGNQSDASLGGHICDHADNDGTDDDDQTISDLNSSFDSFMLLQSPPPAVDDNGRTMTTIQDSNLTPTTLSPAAVQPLIRPTSPLVNSSSLSQQQRAGQSHVGRFLISPKRKPSSSMEHDLGDPADGYNTGSLQPSLILLATPTASADQHFRSSLSSINSPTIKSRTPGHGIHMHERLSARSQRKTANSIRDLEEKQDKARLLRQRHLLERTDRVHELSKKIDEAHMQKRLLLCQRRSCLERRLHAAERKRQAELDRRVLKAHDEQTKGREIAFIQTLEAEQKQFTILTKHEESRARLNELAAGRKRRLEEKAGREEAVKDRRKALEESRMARLDALQARWRRRAQQLASKAEQAEESRKAAARAKEQHREDKLASLEAQQRCHIEQLKSKIERKQQDSERRHQETLREISRKAFEMSVLTLSGNDDDGTMTAPGLEPYPVKKWCRACQVMISSEVSLKSHLYGKKHQAAINDASPDDRPMSRLQVEQFNLQHLVDAPAHLLNTNLGTELEAEQVKQRRKRIRKLRQRMNLKAVQFTKELEQIKVELPESTNKSSLQKLVKDVRRLLNLPDSGPWVANRVQAMEKALSSLTRLFSRPSGSVGGVKSRPVLNANASAPESAPNRSDQLICLSLGLLSVLTNLIGLGRDEQKRASGKSILPDKTLQLAANVIRLVCYKRAEACRRMLFTNDASTLVDLLTSRMSSALSSTSNSGSSSTANQRQPLSTISDSLVNDSVDLRTSSSLSQQSSSSFRSPTNSVTGGKTNNSNCLIALLHCLTCILTGIDSDQSSDSSPTVVNSWPSCSSGGGGGDQTSSQRCQSLYNPQLDINRIQDFLSYVVASGLVDLLTSRLSSPCLAASLLLRQQQASTGTSSTKPSPTFSSGGGDGHPYKQNQSFVLSSIAFLSALLRLMSQLVAHQFSTGSTFNWTPSQLMSVTGSTDKGQTKVTNLVTSSSSEVISSSTSITTTGESVKNNNKNANNMCGRQFSSSWSVLCSCERVRSRRLSCQEEPIGGDESSTSSTVTGSLSMAQKRPGGNGNQGVGHDPTNMLNTIVQTDGFGLVPLLYSLLIDPGNSTTKSVNGRRINDDVSSATAQPSSLLSPRSSHVVVSSSSKIGHSNDNDSAIGQIALATLRLLNSLAVVNQTTLQSVLSDELSCLLMRHILTTLVTQCCCKTGSDSQSVADTDTPSLSTRRVPSSSSVNKEDDDYQSSSQLPLLPSNARQVVIPSSTGIHSPSTNQKQPSASANQQQPTPSSSGKRGRRLPVMQVPDWALSIDAASTSVTSSSSPPSDKRPVISSANTDTNQQQSSLILEDCVKKSTTTTSIGSMSKAILAEALVCIGHLCSRNADNQSALLQSGPSPCLLNRLLTHVPFDYFSRPPLTHLLYPTLIAACYQNPVNSQLLCSQVSSLLLANYIEERLLDQTMTSLSSTTTKTRDNSGLESRFRFEHRFPVSEWQAAQIYFANCQQQQNQRKLIE